MARTVSSFIMRISSHKHIRWYIAAMGLSLALLYSFGVFPHMSTDQYACLDCDHYGDLAEGLLNYGTVSYFPDPGPTVARGPVYPLLISALLMVSNHWFPGVIQLTQCVFFGIVILLVYWIAKELYGREVALLSAAVCALHPFLIWYTPKIWLEVILTLSFTSVVAGALYLQKRPSLARAALLGLLLGLTTLIKATFLPFIVLIPLWLAFVARRKVRATHALAVALVAVLCIMPWSIRNYRLTGTFVPVHVLLGYNLVIGDEVVTHWSERPFSQAYLFKRGERALNAIIEQLPPTSSRWEKEGKGVFQEEEGHDQEIPGYVRRESVVSCQKVCDQRIDLLVSGGEYSEEFPAVVDAVALCSRLLHHRRVHAAQKRSGA